MIPYFNTGITPIELPTTSSKHTIVDSGATTHILRSPPNYKAALLKPTLYDYSSVLAPLPNTTNSIIAKADSGATKHYFPLHTTSTLQHVHDTPSGPTVHLADDTTIKAKAQGILPLSQHLTQPAKTTHLFTEIKTPLLSLGQLCDDGCEIHLTAKI